MRAKVASAERRNSAPSHGCCSSYHRRAPCMSSSASGRRTRRRVTPQPRGVRALLPKDERWWDLRGGRHDGGPVHDGATREQAPTLHLRRCCPTGLRPARFAPPRERQEFASCCVCHRKSLANSHLFAKSPYDDGDPDPIRGRAKLAERLPLRGPQTRDFQIRRLGGQSKFMSASYRNSNLQTKCSQPAKCVTSCMNFGALVDGVGTPALE